MKGGNFSNAFGQWVMAGSVRQWPAVSRLAVLAFVLASLQFGEAPAAWTPFAPGLEALNLSGRPTLLALPGAGSNVAPSSSALRVLVVADESPEGLRFVDPDAGTELGVLSLSHKPVAIAVDSGGARAYVLTANDQLHVVEIATRTLLTTFKLGGDPTTLLLREEAGHVVELLVAQKDPNRVRGVNPATGAVLRWVELDRDPATLAWGLGGSRVIVGARRGGLYTLDAASLAILTTAQIGDEIKHLSWWEGGGGLAIAVHKRADGVSLVDIATGQVSAFVALDGEPERGMVDAGLARLYVTTRDDFSVNRVNLTTRALEGRYALPEKAAGSLFDGSTGKLIVSQRGDRRLLRLDPAQATLISVLQLKERLRDIAVNNVTHEAIAVADKADELTRVKLLDRSAATVALPSRPRFVAVDTALDLAVVGMKNKQVRFVDLAPAAGPVLLPERVTLPDEPEALAVDVTRNLTIALTDSKRKIHFINNTTRTLLSSISLNEDAEAAALHTGRGLGYVLTDKKKLLLVSLDTRAVVQTIGLEFGGNAIAVSEALDRAVITTDHDNKTYVLDLATLGAGTTSLSTSGFAQAHTLPRKPGAVAIQPDTHVAVITSRESDAVSTIDLATGASNSAFVSLEKPFALAITSRYNQALVLSGERDEVAFVQLPNPVPVLETVAPSGAAAGAGPLTLTLTGRRFIDASRAVFGTTVLTTRWLSHTQLEADVPAALLARSGTMNVTVLNPTPAGGASNALVFTIGGAPALAISAMAPSSGPVDTLVTLTGTGFDPVPAHNQLVFRGVDGTTVPAAALTATATQITVRVPPLAETGPITLTNSRGTVQSPPFTVTREQDFQLVVSPASLIVYQGASNSAQIQLSSTGTRSFTGLAALAAQGLPAGVTPSFSPAATISGAQPVTVTFGATTTATPGNYSLTIRGDIAESGQRLARTALITVSVQSAAAVTGLKGRFVTPERVGIGGVIVRADIATNPQPQTTTDAAGNFTLVGLPAGPVTLRFDATPANPLYPIWPYTTTLPANQITVLPDWTINPPPTADKFIPIANAAQEQVITDPRFPGLEIRLPAGATITGWDGVTKTRIAVEKVDLTKLPVTAPPVPTGSTYQMYFGTPMGGVPSTPIPVTLPNDVGGEPGDSINIWFFDGSPMGGTGEWKIAGQGIVSADGKTIRMPNGTGIPRFCGVCGLLCPQNQNPNAATDPGATTCPGKAGNPVTLSTGQESPTNGGLNCGGLTPVSTGMTYNPVDAFNNVGGAIASLGFGWVLDYDIAFLPFNGPQKRLILPGNNRVNFTDDGTGVYRSVDDPRFDGAEIRAISVAASEWELKFRDGRVWRFRPFAAGVPIFVRGGFPTFVTEMVDAQGNVLPIQRQSNGRISSVGTGERGVTMTYGANGFVSQIADTAARTMSFTYTAADRLASVTDSDGRVTSYSYVDDSEFVAPSVCGFQPSFGERLKTITYPGRPTPTENFYGPGRRVLRQTGYDGREFRFDYKVSGACVTHVSSPATRCTGPQCPEVDSWDNFQAGWRIHGGTVIATTVTRPNGRTTTTEFNTRGVTTSRTDAQGQRMATKVDAANRVTERTDALNRTWKYQYDAKGNVTQVTDPLNRLTNYTYDPKWNRVTSITRFNEANQPQTWQFSHDATKGTLLTATNPLNQTTNFAYTLRGELERVTDPLTHATQFAYDSAGDLTSITDALGNITRFNTDGAGRRTRTTDPMGFVTATQYNGIDQVTQVTDARNKSTQLAYDPAGRLASVTNARGFAIESYGYDSGDRLTSRSDAKQKATGYTYDSAGRLLSMTDRRGQVSSYDYDEQNRIISITRPEGVTRFSYDAAGRLTEISDPASTISYGYDAVDRLIREAQLAGGVRSEITYAYDALDRRISRSVDSVANETTNYGYDRANRLTRIAYRGQTTTFEYDTAGRLARKVLPNGIVQALAYDDADRLLSIAYGRPDNTLIESISYSYDPNGRRVTEAKGMNPVLDTAFTAAYDEADRMTSITLTGSGQSFLLDYDDNGNLISKTEQSGSGAVTRYSWDSRNRLASITAPGLAATLEYDALNRRVARTINGLTTRYVYDGLQAIAEIEGSATNTLLTGFGLDEVIARYTSTGARTYLTDALNTVIAQTREDQSIQNFYAYSPYGQASALGVDEGNPIQYTARENDQTGLYYYRARYYDPVLKRFVSEDPIGLPAGPNFYAYTNGKPTNFVDPLGLWQWGDPLPQSVVDSFAGFGDTLTSGFGLFDTSFTKLARQELGVDDLVCVGSNAYRYGRYAAYVWAAVTAGAAARAAQLRPFGNLGPEWHLGLEYGNQLNLIHVGRHIEYGVHVALGNVAPMQAWFHVYLQSAFPFVRFWVP